MREHTECPIHHKEWQGSWALQRPSFSDAQVVACLHAGDFVAVRWQGTKPGDKYIGYWGTTEETQSHACGISCSDGPAMDAEWAKTEAYLRKRMEVSSVAT